MVKNNIDIKKVNNAIKDKYDEINLELDKKYDEKNKNKKRKSICGISYWRIFGYLVEYSVLGYLVEVLYGIITKGVVESRQSFLYGPFCTIYGVGAVVMILCLKKINSKNKIINFVVSGFIGCVIEYLVSWFGETFLHVKWWDYSNYFLNINGRVCLYFGIFWGLLGLLLIEVINPRVDSLIDKMKDVFSRRKQNTIIILSNIFLLFDCIVTIIAIDLYQTRVIHDNNLDVKHKDYYEQHYQNIYSDEKVKNKIETTWGNEVMIKTFPNLKITNSSGDIIYLNSFYPDIQNYYIKLFDNETMNLVNGE